MTIEELTQIATDFLRENYGMELKIPIVRNNRLRRAQGRYIATWEDVPLRIEIAGYLFKYAAPEVIVDTLKHELIHYALHVKGEPFDDGHPHFEAELRKHGASSSKTCRVGIYVLYKCANCAKESKSRGKRLMTEYPFRVTRCCRAKIIIVGERIYDGTEAI